MSRRLLVAAGLLGAAGVVGLLHGLWRGEPCHPLAVMAAIFGFVLTPLVERALRRSA